MAHAYDMPLDGNPVLGGRITVYLLAVHAAQCSAFAFLIPVIDVALLLLMKRHQQMGTMMILSPDEPTPACDAHAFWNWFFFVLWHLLNNPTVPCQRKFQGGGVGWYILVCAFFFGTLLFFCSFLGGGCFLVLLVHLLVWG